MELTTVGRVLRQRRWFVAGAFVLAIAVAVMMSYQVSLGLPPKFHSKQTVTGQASAQVLIDTQKSQVADTQALPNASALYTGAALLADMMATAPAAHDIARQLGIPPTRLGVMPPPSSVVTPIKATPLAVTGTRLTTKGTWQLVVTLDPSLPIVAFSASAPTADDAQRLAAASIAVLHQRIHTLSAAQKIPANRRIISSVIGPPVGGSLSQGPRKALGLAAAIFVFFALCFVIVIVSEALDRRAQKQQLADPAPAAVSNGHAATSVKPQDMRRHREDEPHARTAH